MTVKKISTTQKVDWSVPKPGMRLIKPTSIANTGGSASINTNGSVTFSSVSSITINGVFSALYENYHIVLNTTAGNSMRFQLAASGTPATTNYTRQYIDASSTSIGAVRQTSQTYGSLAQPPGGDAVSLYGPFLAQATAVRSVSASTYLNAYIIDNVNTHSTASSYDGIKLFPDSSTITGKVAIYGVSK